MSEEPKHPNDPDRVRLRDWLGLARAVPAAFDPRKLLIAAVGLLVLQAGWSAIDRFATPSGGAAPHFLGVAGLSSPSSGDPVAEVLRRAWSLTGPVGALVEPLSAAFATPGPGGGLVPALGRFLVSVVVLGIVGGAVCRLAAVEAEGGGRGRLRDALGFAFRRAGGLASVPLYPTAIVLMLGAVSAGFGLIARLVPPLAPAASVVPMILGLASAALLAFAVASWPLAHASMATESEEAVTAIGRGYGYVGRRPMALAACAAAALVLGTLGLAAFAAFLGVGAHLAAWGMGLAGGPGPIGGGGGAWASVFGLALQAWAFAYFWCAAVRSFLILRQDLDGGREAAPAIGTTAGGSAARL